MSTISIQSDSFALFGEAPVAEDGPRKTVEAIEAERRADRVGYRALLKERRWTADDFAAAQRHGLPAPIARHFGPSGAGETVYSRKQLTAWAAQIKRLAAGL